MASLGIVIVVAVPSFVKAAPTEDPCEKLHTDYLLKAQKALSEDKRDDALRYLLEAQAVAKRCAGSFEQPLPQNQTHETGHASSHQLSFS